MLATMTNMKTFIKTDNLSKQIIQSSAPGDQCKVVIFAVWKNSKLFFVWFYYSVKAGNYILEENDML